MSKSDEPVRYWRDVNRIKALEEKLDLLAYGVVPILRKQLEKDSRLDGFLLSSVNNARIILGKNPYKVVLEEFILGEG